VVALACSLTLGCGGDVESTSGGAPMPEGPPGSRRYVGCVSPTSTPQMFVLSVLEGRDFSTCEPPGTPIPQRSDLPGGVAAPVPPVPATQGSPGGGPTPTTKVVTYALAGDAAADIAKYVGHTIEAQGTVTREAAGDIPGALNATAIRDLAPHCR
jgi:hypothetical protein